MGKRRVIAVLLALFAVGVPAALLDAALLWDLQTVDGEGRNGKYTDMAIDSQGRPHIAYAYSADDKWWLRYAFWNGTSWSIQTLQNAGAGIRVHYGLSLALDAGDRPRICYADYDSVPWNALIYAAWDGAQWTFESVGGQHGYDVCLKLAANGYPRISYCDSPEPYPLKFAAWNGAQWSIETVDDPGPAGCGGTSLALDTDGHPRISYGDAQNKTLKYAEWSGTGWAVETVDDGGGVSTGQGSRLALDARGYPQISYMQAYVRCLKYAAWNGASWDIQVVDPSTARGWQSLAVEPDGTPHLLYETTGYPSDLMYGVWNGTSWDFEKVDTVYEGTWCSLALDGSTYPHIVYVCTADHLTYGTGHPPLAVRWPR
jgi:hypothetical protein